MWPVDGGYDVLVISASVILVRNEIVVPVEVASTYWVPPGLGARISYDPCAAEIDTLSTPEMKS